MTFSVCKAIPYRYNSEIDDLEKYPGGVVEARKKYIGNKKARINEWGVFTLDTPAGQPFHKYERLCQGFADELAKLDSYKEPLVIIRGNNIKESHSKSQNTNYSRTSSDYVLDSLSRFFIFDIDYFTKSDSISAKSGVKARYSCAVRERLSFLQGKRVVVQASSSAGIEYVVTEAGKKDYSKRISLRVIVEFDKEYTIKELNEKLINHLSKGESRKGEELPELCDTAYLKRHAQKTYIQSANLIDTECHLTGDKVIFLEGGALKLKEITETVEWRKASKVNISALPFELYQDQSRDFAKVLSYLESKPWGDANKFDFFNAFFSHYYFYNPDTVIPLLFEIQNNRHLVTPEFPFSKYEQIARYQHDKALCKLACVDRDMRHEFGKRLILDSVDLSEEINIVSEGVMEPCDFFEKHIKDASYLGFASDCGTAKTKGVIKHLIKHCKEEGKSLLYIANTKAIVMKQCEEFGINSYIKNGELKGQKETVIKSSSILGMCYMSLHYFDASSLDDWNYDYIVIDEASQVLRGWDSDPNIARDKIDILFGLCDKAGHVHLYDADLDDELCSWFLMNLSGYKAEKASLFINNAKRAEGYQVQLADTRATLVKDIINCINDGKKVCVFLSESNEKLRMNAFSEFIKDKTDIEVNYLAFDKTQTEQKLELVNDTRTYLSKKLKGGLNLLVLNSWAGIGFDYYDSEEHFDKTYIIDSYGFITAKRKWQFLRRMRTCRSAMVFSNYSNELPHYYKLEKLVTKHKGLDISQLKRLESWYSRARHCIEMDRAKGKWHFKSQLEYRGAIYSDANNNKDESREIDKQLKDYIKRYQKENGVTDDKESQELLSIIDNFMMYEVLDGGSCDWVGVDLSIALDNRSQLIKEHKMFSTDKAKKMSEYLAMTDYERAINDREDPFGFSLEMGELLESFLELIMHDDLHSLKNFLQWYLTDPTGEITLTLDWINRDAEGDFIKSLKKYKYIIPEYFSIPKDSHIEPKRAIEQIANYFGLDYVKKDTKNVGKVKARNDLFDYHSRNKTNGFDKCRSLTQKSTFCINIIKANGGNLNKFEIAYINSTKYPYSLQRKKFVHKAIWNPYLEKLEKLIGANAQSRFEMLTRNILQIKDANQLEREINEEIIDKETHEAPANSLGGNA